DAAGIEHLLRLDVYAAITLLEAEGDIDAAVGAVGSPHHSLASGHVQSGGLLDVDVLARADRGFAVLGGQIDGGRDHHRIDVARQHVPEVVVASGVFGANAFTGLRDLLVHYIANRGDLHARVFRDFGSGIGSPASGADQTHLDGAVLGRAAHGLE